jgi:hypothetical protein
LCYLKPEFPQKSLATDPRFKAFLRMCQKDPELYVAKSETELQSLRTGPRFKAFLRKMNLPE